MNEHLPTLLLQILLVGFTPGPANIYALTMSLRHGRTVSLVMWLGMLTGFSIAVSVMALLTHLLGVAFGAYVGYMKVLGAAYIFYLAYWIWRSSETNNTAKTRECGFVSGMLVQLTNAKMLLFDLTVFSTFVLPYSDRLEDLFETAAWLLIAGPGANLTWLMAGGVLRNFFLRYGRQVDHFSAVALVLGAIYLLCF